MLFNSILYSLFLHLCNYNLAIWSPIPIPSMEFWTPAFSDDLLSLAKRLDIGSDLVILTFIGNGSKKIKCNLIQQL